MFPTPAFSKLRFWCDRTLLIGFFILLPIHFALAKLSTVFTFSDGSAAIWPSSGVFLATILLFGRRFWIVLLLCDFIINRVLFFNTPASFPGFLTKS